MNKVLLLTCIAIFSIQSILSLNDHSNDYQIKKNCSGRYVNKMEVLELLDDLAIILSDIEKNYENPEEVLNLTQKGFHYIDLMHIMIDEQ